MSYALKQTIIVPIFLKKGPTLTQHITAQNFFIILLRQIIFLLSIMIGMDEI